MYINILPRTTAVFTNEAKLPLDLMQLLRKEWNQEAASREGKGHQHTSGPRKLT